MFRMAKNICKVENNYVRNSDCLVKLFYHEAMRYYGDMILMKHDLKWFMTELKKVCKIHLMEEAADLSKEATHNIDSDSPEVGDRDDSFPV